MTFSASSEEQKVWPMEETHALDSRVGTSIVVVESIGSIRDDITMSAERQTRACVCLLRNEKKQKARPKGVNLKVR